jgi:hypothetical protein
MDWDYSSLVEDGFLFCILVVIGVNEWQLHHAPYWQSRCFFRYTESVIQASITEYFVLYICYLLCMYETGYTKNFSIQFETVITR